MQTSSAAPLLPDPTFRGCFLNLERAWLPFPQAGGAREPSVTAEGLVERIERYMESRALDEFSLVVDLPSVPPVDEAFLHGLVQQVRRMDGSGRTISVTLRSRGLESLLAVALPSIATIRGRYCLRLDERHAGSEGDRQLAQWVKLSERLNARLAGTVPFAVETVASPGVAPAAFLRGLAALGSDSIQIHWPSEFTTDSPPWSERFRVDRAQYEQCPVYGQWFADLYRLWWILDDPSLPIAAFEECLDRFNETGTSSDGQQGIPAAFAVSRDGEYRLLHSPVETDKKSSLSTGFVIQAIDIAPLESLRDRHRTWLLSRQVLHADRSHYFERVDRLLEDAGHLDSSRGVRTSQVVPIARNGDEVVHVRSSV